MLICLKPHGILSVSLAVLCPFNSELLQVVREARPLIEFVFSKSATNVYEYYKTLAMALIQSGEAVTDWKKVGQVGNRCGHWLSSIGRDKESHLLIVALYRREPQHPKSFISKNGCSLLLMQVLSSQEAPSPMCAEMAKEAVSILHRALVVLGRRGAIARVQVGDTDISQ